MRYLLLLATFCISLTTNAQILDPVKWKTEAVKVSDQEFDLIFTAIMEDGWTIYSQFTDDNGPVPTYFEFDKGDHFSLEGKVEEKGKKKEGPDPLFGNVIVIKYVKSPVVFTQRVKVSDASQPVSGFLEFMTCDDSRCLPPSEVTFSFDLTSVKGDKEAVTEAPTVPKEKPTKQATDVVAKQTVDQTEEVAEPQVGLLSETTTTAKTTNSNILTPVKWDIAVKEIAAPLYEITFTANIEDGWTIYSQFNDGNGPIPTEFFFDKARTAYSLEGPAIEEGKLKDGMDPVFNTMVKKFVKGPVLFKQKVKVENPDQAITGALVYMACDDSKCLPPTEEPFSVDIAKLMASIGLEPIASEELTTASDEELSIFEMQRPDLESAIAECGTPAPETGKGYWSIFFLGFIGGLIALLTPCVFPMIPLTVSFFTKGSKDKRKGMTNAFLYGFFIFAVYLILSIPFHLMDSINPDILNDISTNIWLNIAFFAIFLFFAFSFFGYYELTLPSSWSNKASSAEGIGGVIGIFFMALTLALVSFSCTGPILGSLLAGALSSDGGAMQLTAGMGGFGLALALPFGLFAAFPGWMNTLPKSGGWLNSVKVVLGFVELALAFKFLSNADLVKHWGLLKIEPFLAIWILISIGLALYLFGKIKFPHDSPIKKLGITRILLGTLTVLFAVYLATGFIFDEKANSLRPLKLLSGLAPPVCYSWFYPCDCPQNLNCFKDLNEGLTYAKEVNKPILIDFTGHACVNCRKMEEHVWPESKVYGTLKEDYVLISLYVDEKINLPEDEQIEVVYSNTGQKRKLRNYGHKWAYFQTEYFATNTQPYYVLLSPDGQLLNQPVGYTPDVDDYRQFLMCGLDAFKGLTQKDASGQQIGSK